MSTNLKKYDLINYIKFICSIFVVMIHCYPINPSYKYINYFLSNIIRISVPFFFICSGYFLYNKFNSNSNQKIKQNVLKYIYRILKMYIIWNLIYFIFNFNNYYKLGVIKGSLIFIRDIVFQGSQFHLWYLVASCLSTYIIYLFLIRNKYRLLIILSIISYLFCSISGSYYNLFDETKLSKIINIIYLITGGTWTSFLIALPLMMFGVIINKYSLVNKIKSINKFIIVSFTLFIIEAVTLNYIGISRTSATGIFLPFFTASIFIYGLSKENYIQEKSIIRKYSKLFRDLSLYIYLNHVIYVNLIKSMSDYILIRFFIVCLLSITTGIITIHLKTKIQQTKKLNLNL